MRPFCPAIGGVKVAKKERIEEMNLDYVLNLGREAIFLTLIISAPVLLFSFIVGIFMSIIQASTQIQETGLNFIPKLLAVALALVLFLPWMLQKLIDFSTELFEYIPFLTR
jgi:flagellar biosynthetic protein FliQ